MRLVFDGFGLLRVAARPAAVERRHVEAADAQGELAMTAVVEHVATALVGHEAREGAVVRERGAAAGRSRVERPARAAQVDALAGGDAGEAAGARRGGKAHALFRGAAPVAPRGFERIRAAGAWRQRHHAPGQGIGMQLVERQRVGEQHEAVLQRVRLETRSGDLLPGDAPGDGLAAARAELDAHVLVEAEVVPLVAGVEPRHQARGLAAHGDVERARSGYVELEPVRVGVDDQRQGAVDARGGVHGSSRRPARVQQVLRDRRRRGDQHGSLCRRCRATPRQQQEEQREAFHVAFLQVPSAQRAPAPQSLSK